jgi:DNA modification methylase
VDYKPLVFDPFLGGASCGRTALMMGYRFSGVELYEKNIETSRRILAESLQEFEPRALNQIEAEMVFELVA